MAAKKVDMGHVTPHCVQMMYNDVFVALFAELMEDFGIFRQFWVYLGL